MKQRRVLEVVVGIYVATLLVSAAALAGWDSGAADLSAGVFVAAGVAIAAIVGLAVRAVDDLVDRLLSLPVASGLMGLPLVALLSLIFVVDLGSGADIVAVGAMVAMILGIITLFGARVIRTRRLREQATEIVSVTVGDDDEDGTRLGTAAIAIVGIVVSVILIGGGIGLILGYDLNSSAIISSLTGVFTSLLVFADKESEVVVTDTGLYVDQQFLQWEDLTGYRLTDESVEIVTPNWYQSTRTFDREEISDEDTFINGLSEFLPRIDEHGRVELSARN
ncbi:MAG: hypothetical protein ACOC0Z_07790 [Halohasta sp.]